jgi:hypothetical protein
MTNKYKITIEIDMGKETMSDVDLKDLAWDAKHAVKQWIPYDAIITESTETIDYHNEESERLIALVQQRLTDSLKEEV